MSLSRCAFVRLCTLRQTNVVKNMKNTKFTAFFILCLMVIFVKNMKNREYCYI